MRPFCCASTLSVSLLVLWPPLLLLLLHSHHQLVGHTHFHAHTWSSSDVRGAVIYGARSLSVYAGNSNTHGRTAGKERRGEEGAPGCSPLLTFTFLSNAHTYFLHFFFSLFFLVYFWRISSWNACVTAVVDAHDTAGRVLFMGAADKAPQSVGENIWRHYCLYHTCWLLTLLLLHLQLLYSPLPLIALYIFMSSPFFSLTFK